MICIGKVKEIDKVKHLPKNLVEKINELVQVLDNEYGSERDIDRDLGGYVAVLEEAVDIELLKESNLDIETEIPEWVEEVVDKDNVAWMIALFILSDDYSIVVVTSGNTIDLRGKD